MKRLILGASTFCMVWIATCGGRPNDCFEQQTTPHGCTCYYRTVTSGGISTRQLCSMRCPDYSPVSDTCPSS